MKIRKIAFKNHPVLGNISCDFTDEKGKTVDTIILAGENGCGKTVLLNELFNYKSNFNNKDISISIEVEFNNKELEIIFDNKIYRILFKDKKPTNIFNIEIDDTKKYPENRIEIKFNDTNDNVLKSNQNCLPLNNLFKFIFSDVEINFTPKEIKSVTARNIDDEINNNIKSSSNLATEITQLLIDIDNLDKTDLANWVDKHRGEAPPENVQKIRIKRFTNAFNSIFPKKRFVSIENNNNHKEVIFEENGKCMSIDKLSSGEKQIVFRGGFLLKNKKSTEGSIVLIDEPEISLHPNWQLKILDFLKSLFTDEEGKQTSQLIIATHSPFIIHNHTRNNDKVIVLKKDENGIITVSDNPQYYSWTDEKIVEEAFSINYSLPTNKITIFVEGITDEKYYKRAIEVYNYKDKKIDFQWIGRNTSKGKSENTGYPALNNALVFYKSNYYMIPYKIVLLFDCDTHKQEETLEDKIYVRTMLENKENSLYEKGVENLFVLPEGFKKDDFYKKTEKKDAYGAKSTITTFEKTKLCSYICGLSNDKLTPILVNLKGEIDKILNEVESSKEKD